MPLLLGDCDVVDISFILFGETLVMSAFTSGMVNLGSIYGLLSRSKLYIILAGIFSRWMTSFLNFGDVAPETYPGVVKLLIYLFLFLLINFLNIWLF